MEKEMIQQSFTAATHQDLMIEIAQFLREENFYVVHNDKLPSKRMTFREVAEKYRLTSGALSKRLKTYRHDFPHERGREKILWMVVTPELHDRLSKPMLRHRIEHGQPEVGA